MNKDEFIELFNSGQIEVHSNSWGCMRIFHNVSIDGNPTVEFSFGGIYYPCPYSVNDLYYFITEWGESFKVNYISGNGERSYHE